MRVDSTSHGVSPSEAVVEKVATLEGVEPTELTPLYDVIDSEALDALIGSPSESRSPGIEVQFTYHGYDVTVDAEGVVRVAAPTAVTR